MTRNAILASALLLAVSCSTTTPKPATTAAAQPSYQTTRVDLSRFNGKFVGSVNPDGQPVTAWVRGSEAGLTEDKKPVVGVVYSGAPDQDNVSVTVAVLANDGNAKTEAELTKIPVATYRVGPGQSITVDLSRFGMPPMYLRGNVKTTQQ
jgi:hypothetical protein